MKFRKIDLKHMTHFSRAFSGWLKINQPRFFTPPFEILTTYRYIGFTIPGLHPDLHFKMYPSAIGMFQKWQGVGLAMKVFETLPQRVTEGYVCGFCLDECKQVYPTLEELWSRRVFEPLLIWVNSELTPPRWLVWDSLKGPVTEAHFIDHHDTHWCVILPVWADQNN